MKEQVEMFYNEYLDEKLDQVFQKKSYSKLASNTHREIKFDNQYQIRRRLGKYYLVGPNGKNVQIKINKEVSIENETIEFHDGLAVICDHIIGGCNYYNYIDLEGNLLLDHWYVWICDFKEGYAVVNDGTYYYLIDKHGIPLAGKKFYNAWSFHEGIARVKNSDCKYYFINTDGERISEDSFEEAGDFHEGLAKVRIGYYYYKFIDKNGDFLPEMGYKFNYAGDFHDGFAVVKQGDEYNYIDHNGVPLSDEWFINATDFSCGVGLVKTKDGMNYINKHGKFISKKPFKKAGVFYNGLAIVENNGKRSLINTDGEVVSDEFYNEKDNIEILNSTTYKVNGKCHSINYFVKDNKVIETKRGYSFIKNDITFEVKHTPIMTYGTRYVLCLHKNGKNIILYDKDENKYTDIGSVETIDYDENFIINHRSKKVHLMYNNQMIDITEYYCQKLKDKKEIYVTEAVSILTPDEFMIDDEYSKRAKKHRAREQKLKEEQKRKEEEEKLAFLQFKKKIKDKDREKSVENAITIIQEKFGELERYFNETGIIKRVKIGNAIMKVGNHREINMLIVKMGWLKFVDLSGESFIDVKVDGIDFTDCNVTGIIPQRVYKKNLSKCTFVNVHLEPLLSFEGVNICGATFKEEESAIPPNFSGAIYDKNTTYNGIPIEQLPELLNKEKIQR